MPAEGKPTTVDEYLAAFDGEAAERLAAVRAAIHEVLPGAEEKLRYDIPAVSIRGRYWLHFAGWKQHIGLYPVPRADDELEARIAPWRAAKDTVNLPYSKPLPLDLVRDIAGLMLELHGGEEDGD
ncbi:uncharacterized protein YdhG (YjbR/CyaY superfamily) [Agromyces terreus]|uniref:Uncharacterized protein YdhG (YjbR/CyaY superfamily) n=1 Tax=Agromyces terreus TaxID=424795 RepID=A0A9X2H2F9_9MICO|nr:DUF1801 domain-containing protein [Agromyces terreus]MCP2369632.1 uncharacterized protein YdhG (YjbR/CyaY superfamily) [Agromyces terreus]